MDDYKDTETVTIDNIRELTDELKKLNRTFLAVYELLRQRLR